MWLLILSLLGHSPPVLRSRGLLVLSLLGHSPPVLLSWAFCPLAEFFLLRDCLVILTHLVVLTLTVLTSMLRWRRLFRPIGRVMGGSFTKTVALIQFPPFVMGGHPILQLVVFMGGLQVVAFMGGLLHLRLLFTLVMGGRSILQIMGGLCTHLNISLKRSPLLRPLQWSLVVRCLVLGFPMCRHQLGHARASRSLVRRLFLWLMRTYVRPRLRRSRCRFPHLSHLLWARRDLFHPPLAPTSSPLVHRYGHGHGIPAPAPVPVAPTPALAGPPHVAASRPLEPLKLSPLKDEKAVLDNYDLIQYYLRVPEFSTGRPDDTLLTDSSNADASRMWEGQLRLAVKDGSLKYLFDNKGDLYNGRGFEMLAALVQHCRPDLVANAFPSLLSLFNDVQGAEEPILQYRSRFDGIIMELSRCKVQIPQILMVMLFLRSIHSRYAEIVEQFRTRFQSIETATLDSIVEGIKFHDGFTVHERKGSKPSGPRAAAATAGGGSNSDQRGQVWRTPFEWLSVTKRDVIKGRWTRALAGTGICPICHCPDKPWHVPSLCPLLKELHLKIDILPGNPPAPSAAPAPPPGATPSGRVATADESAVSGSSASGSASVPSGLVSSVLPSVHAPDEYESDEDFRWAGDKSGLDYGNVSSSKSKSSFAGYLPSCNHTQLVSTSCLASSSVSCISLPHNLMTAITSLCKSSIRSPTTSNGTAGNLAVADTGATDHMLPDASAFISYKRVHDLSVRMGNNSFVPVLGRGTAVFSLNGKPVLVSNVLHVPGLAVPLYSLRAHLHQRGCGFLGTFDDGFHVYFPSFVLSADMSSDCHLTYESLGKWVTLDSLHYVQPRCAATLYPSETSASTTAFVPPVAVIEDDDASSADVTNDTPCAKTSPPVRVSSDPLPLSLPEQSTLDSLSDRLEELSRLVQYLVPTPKSTAKSSERPHAIHPPLSPSSEDLSMPRLLSTISRADVLRLVHLEGTSLPSIRPCDTANSCDKKTHWSA